MKYNAEDCSTYVHYHWVSANVYGSSRSGPGCLRTGGHAVQVCAHHQVAVNPVQATNKLTDEVRCDVCEQFKPLHILSGHGKQWFDNVEVLAPQWGWGVRFSGRRWPQVCPDCMALFKEYRTCGK